MQVSMMKSMHLRAIVAVGNNNAFSPGWPYFVTIASAKAPILLWTKNLDPLGSVHWLLLSGQDDAYLG